ncbi:MAG: DUF2854 domain-containing protein [Cyanobacteria bacterium CRU_2_1]|nr:DUF2854 domain-containing protein [Cyanobacteria bacterium RU_5_0]NJR59823.1 DUF2854 domain-containing protein [Cyanobacteria bacterium CRU_2_1]
MVRQISLGTLGLVVGSFLSVVGFAAYFSENATLNLVGFFYGIPLLLGGLALKAAELKPVPFSKPTSSEVLALREKQATAIQKQIRTDVTRYRYGQKAHLDSSLSYLGLAPSDEERPVLQGVREEEVNGTYVLVLEFDAPLIGFEVWQQKQEKFDRFFGSGLRVELRQPEKERVDLALIAVPES